MPSVEELERMLAEAKRTSTQTNIPTFPNLQNDVVIFPSPSPQSEVAANPYAATTWGSNEYDFKTPTGQLCRLKRLDVAELAKAGILDRVTRLPGLTAELVARSEGQPPAAEVMPDKETIETVLEVLHVFLPIVVVQPQIWPLPADGEERKPERIYVDSIDIVDQVAIMTRALQGLKALDSFRPES
jgi:hypothetical protein